MLGLDRYALVVTWIIIKYTTLSHTSNGSGGVRGHLALSDNTGCRHWGSNTVPDEEKVLSRTRRTAKYLI